MKKIAVVALLLATVLAPTKPANAACIAIASSGVIKSGSTISAGTLTICASTTTAKTAVKKKVTVVKKAVVKKAVTVVKKPAVVVKKVVAPTPVKPACIINSPVYFSLSAAGISGCTLIVTPPTTKVVSAPKVSTSSSTTVSTQSDQASFTPNPVSISASSKSGLVGQTFFFSAIALAHTKSGTVLGKAATVSFQPTSYSWSGGAASGTSYSTSWSSVGSHSVSLSVVYAASYQLAGTSGWVSAGNITSSASTSVLVDVISTTPVTPVTPVVTKKSPPLLVSGKCNGSGYRC